MHNPFTGKDECMDEKTWVSIVGVRRAQIWTDNIGSFFAISELKNPPISTSDVIYGEFKKGWDAWLAAQTPEQAPEAPETSGPDG